MANHVSAINPTGMYFEIMTVTPVMATAWLAKMPKNEQRNLRPSRVTQYGQLRQQGKWVLHHQGIAFDTKGVFRDGQHRLNMIVQTGLPTVLVVAFNVPEEAFLHVDEQLPRGVKDAIKMAGRGNYDTSICATARVMYAYPAKDNDGGITFKEVILNRLQTWAEQLEFAENELKAVPGVTRSVRALVARAHAVIPESERDRLKEWCRIMRDGMPGDLTADTAAITYRNFLLSKVGGAPGQYAEMEKYRKGQSCLAAFLRREPMSKVYGSEKDLFPVPKDRLEQ